MAAEIRNIDDPQAITRIILRPLGSPLPLGFYAFGVGLMLMSAVELHWIGPADARNIPMVLFAFVAPLEMLACILAFFARDTAAATAMGLFALSWVVQGLVMLHQAAEPSTTVAIFLALLAVTLLCLAILSYRAKPLLAVILGLAFARSACAGVVQFGVKELSTVTAALGIALVLLSLYGGTAFLIEDLRQTTVLPLFRRGPAHAAVHGNLHDQIDRVARESGVRQQL